MNTNVITALGMRKVCTEAVHSVALWTRTLSQLWACVKYVPKQSILWHENARTEHVKAPVNTKTRKPENANTGGINLWTRKRRKRENGENAKTAKTRKPRKRGKRENGENPKTRKRRKRRKPENGQKCSCFLVFNFSFSGFLGFLGFLVFSFSGFLVPLAASFWPGRVFYVLSLILNVAFYFNLFRRGLCLQNSVLASVIISEVIKKVSSRFITSRTGSHNCSEQWKPMSQNACFIPSYSYLSRWFCDVLYLTQFPRTLFSFRFSSQDQFVLLEFFVEVASLGLAPGERPKTSEVVLTCCLVVYDYICLYRFQSVCAYIINMYTVYKQVYSSTQMYGHAM